MPYPFCASDLIWTFNILNQSVYASCICFFNLMNSAKKSTRLKKIGPQRERIFLAFSLSVNSDLLYRRRKAFYGEQRRGN
jgi:hypothetical protein